ncbi:MAG: hypothetical protein R2783_00330 [Gelidibacter sp.]
MHQKINEELASTQDLYDQETDNSVNREFQEKWNRYVKLELTKLEPLKSKD